MKSATASKLIDKYVVTEQLLGKGSFGNVYRGFLKENKSKLVAVKTIPLTKLSKNQSEQSFMLFLKREIQILKKLDSEYVVRLYNVSRTKTNLYLFLEYCRDGDLAQILKQRNGRLSQAESIEFFRQICEGFKEIYSKKIVHRDIKPANILIHERKAKISDFGFAKVNNVEMETPTDMTMVGTPLYMSPQILQNKKFSSKCDIWSMGMMFFQMLYGFTPFNGKTPQDLLNNIKNKPLVFPDRPLRSDLVKNVIRIMLVVNQDDRADWPSIFSSDIMCDQADTVYNKILQINNSQTDSLLKSKALNDLYIEKNKVIGTDRGQRTLKAFRQKDFSKDQKYLEEKKQKQLQNQKQIGQDIAKALNYQNQLLQKARLSAKVDKFVVFKRNQAIFLNVTTTQFFSIYKSKKYVPEWVFYICLFCLQKEQMSLFENIKKILSGQNNPVSFTQKQWQVYRSSDQFQVTHSAIKADIKYVFPYFYEVQAKCKSYLKEVKPSSKEDEDFIKDFTNKQLYYDERNEYSALIIRRMLRLVIQADSSKQELLNLFYMLISLRLSDQMRWSSMPQFDFNNFYQYYESLTREELLLKINDKQKLIWP